MNYKYKLQPYSGRNSRYTCPRCKKHHEFIRYVDAETNQPLADHVGMCNRKDKCGYHYTPSDYFRDNGEIREIEIVPSRPPVTTHFDTISSACYSLYYPNTGTRKSNHILHLISLFGKERATETQKKEEYDIADWIQDQIDIGRSVVDIENEFVEAV